MPQWYTLWKSMITPSLVDADALEKLTPAQKASAERKNARMVRSGKRLIAVYACWVAQLVIYAAITIMLILAPDYEELIAINFILFEEAILRFDIQVRRKQPCSCWPSLSLPTACCC
eukprot:SAG22_NODE_1820_length_3514_cov_2.304539_3_plen_117_part_00